MAVYRREPDYSVRPAPLDYVVEVFEGSGVQPLLDSWGYARTVRYSPRTLIIGLLLLGVLRRPIGLAALMHLYWDVLEPAQRQAIGLPLQVPGLASQESFEAEYQRMHTSFKRLTALLDPVPMNQRRSLTQQEYDAYLKKAARDPESELRRGRLVEIVNGLVRASVPARVLTGWNGSLLCDDHIVNIGRNLLGGGAASRRRPAIAHVGLTDRSRKSDWCYGLAVTFAKPVHPERGPRVPEVLLSMSFGAPSSQTTQRALEAVDAALAHAAYPDDRHHRPEFIADQGFNHHGLAEGLLARGIEPLHSHPRSEAPAPVDVGNGIWLSNGRFICHGGRLAVRQLRGPLTEETATDDELLSHQQLVDLVRLSEMPVHEPLAPAQKRRPGRPRANDVPEAAFKVVLVSPCAAGVACAGATRELVRDGEPSIPDPPQGPRADWPEVCRNRYTTVWLTPEQARKYQSRLFGSFEHQDRLRNGRSRDERGQSVVVDPEMGDLRLQKFEVRSLPLILLAVASCVVAANREVVRSWDRMQALKAAPIESSLDARRAARNRRLASAQKEAAARSDRRARPRRV